MSDYVHFLKSGNAGIIKLDRPDALHALSIEMVEQMTSHLLEWQNDHEVGHVIVSSTGQKAFCSGGDVRQAVYKSGSSWLLRRALFSFRIYS